MSSDAWDTAEAEVLGKNSPSFIYGGNLGSRSLTGVIVGDPHVVTVRGQKQVLLNFAETGFTEVDASFRFVNSVKVLVCNEKLFREIVRFKGANPNLEERVVCITLKCDDQPLAEPYYRVEGYATITLPERLNVVNLERAGAMLLSEKPTYA